jgi:hypothetical protein
MPRTLWQGFQRSHWPLERVHVPVMTSMSSIVPTALDVGNASSAVHLGRPPCQCLDILFGTLRSASTS